ncbi:GAF domain-containing protein [Streptomyces sp. Q6]|uniref:GAF domain-containing protein n=1 Tax=Streptomyces citrinus TaxID=3118173 RepID=A0ACD5ANE7_9ACTN
MIDESQGMSGPSPVGPHTVEPRQGVHAASESALEARNRQLARAAVEAAQRTLVHRYRLACPADGFDLLKQASQRFNIKLHTLADAVTRVAGPDADAEQWFPRRARFIAPRLPDLALHEGRAEGQAAVLRAALRRVLHITDTDMGNVQLAEHGMLRLEKHTGLNRHFTDFFAFVQDSTTSCSQAAQQRQQITVKNVESADVFDDDSRHAILQTGSRAAHSLPLTSGGRVLGMISSHHEQPLTGLTQTQLTALERTGTTVGQWLHWHRHTVVLDALEHLHTIARDHG